MKHFEDVKKELTKGGIDWVLGTETGWSDNSIIFDGGDCKILLYVEEDEKGNLSLIYHDLFEEGEYSPIFDNTNEETTTSYRGTMTSVRSMLLDLDLID